MSNEPAVDLTTTIGSRAFRSPVMVASGCGGDGRAMGRFGDLRGLGAFVTPSVTREGSGGRPLPRYLETPSGLLSALGLPGPGVESFVDLSLPWLLEQEVATIVSVAGATLAEYAEVAGRVGSVPGVAGLEVNLAAVEPAAGALKAELARGFARDPVQAGRVVAVVRREAAPGTLLLAKLWPGIASVVDLTAAVLGAGADAVVLPGSLPGLAIDPATLRPQLGGGSGVLSGPAIRAVGLHAVWEVHRAFPDACIVGAGGIARGADVVSYLAAGATAVQVGTAILADPSAPATITSELAVELATHGISRPGDVRGIAHRGGRP